MSKKTEEETAEFNHPTKGGRYMGYVTRVVRQRNGPLVALYIRPVGKSRSIRVAAKNIIKTEKTKCHT